VRVFWAGLGVGFVGGAWGTLQGAWFLLKNGSPQAVAARWALGDQFTEEKELIQRAAKAAVWATQVAESFVRSNGALLKATLQGGNAEAMKQALHEFDPRLARAMIVSRELVLEVLIAAVDMPPRVQGQIVGTILYEVAEALATLGVAKLLKAGALAKLGDFLAGIFGKESRAGKRIGAALGRLSKFFEEGAEAGKAAKAARRAEGKAGAAAGEGAQGEKQTVEALLEVIGQDTCFVAGTPLLTPAGEKLIEQFQPGDVILSRSERDPNGPVETKWVEEVFVRVAPVLNLHVGGRVIRTTAEHPFYVHGKGWITARELLPGDWLDSHDGQRIAVEAVTDSGEVTTVYNLRVAEYHTYFVGSRQWGFSVWAHNAKYEVVRTPQGLKIRNKETKKFAIGRGRKGHFVGKDMDEVRDFVARQNIKDVDLTNILDETGPAQQIASQIESVPQDVASQIDSQLRRKVDEFMRQNEARINDKLGTKLGGKPRPGTDPPEGRLPFPRDAAGARQARETVRETLENGSQVSQPFTSSGGNRCVDVYSEKTNMTVRIREDGTFDTLIPGRTARP
jgi:hypothetical protein